MTNVYVTIGQTLLYPTSGSSLEVERPRWLVVTLVAVHQAPVGRASLPPSRFAGHGGAGARVQANPGRQERAAGYTVQAPVGRHPFTLGGQGSPRPSLTPTQQLLLSHALFDMHRTPRRADLDAPLRPHTLLRVATLMVENLESSITPFMVVLF